MEMQEPPCVCCDVRKYHSTSSHSNYETQQQYRQPSRHDQRQLHLHNHQHVPPRPTKSIISVTTRPPSQHHKKVNANASGIVQETAEEPSSDSDSPEEPPVQEESPSPVEESPSPEDDSQSPVEESPSPVEERVPSKKRHVSTKSAKKPRASANSTGTQYEAQAQRTSLYQQLILNRNIQVFLQVEQFSKQKPIILSRRQYDKVKRTIESTIASKTGREYKRKKCICKTSLVSVGDIRMKSNRHHPLQDKPIQTSKKSVAQKANRKSSIASNKSKGPVKKHSNLVLFAKEEKKFISEIKPRQAMSSMEIQYAGMTYMKCVTFSSTNVEAGSMCPPPLENKESHSIHTIFKGTYFIRG